MGGWREGDIDSIHAPVSECVTTLRNQRHVVPVQIVTI